MSPTLWQRLNSKSFPIAAAAIGLGLGYGAYNYYNDYDYYDASYGYDDGYYGDGGCYIVQRRVLTPYGWSLQPVQVCN